MPSRKRCPSGKIRNKKGKCVSKSRSQAAKRAWKKRSKTRSRSRSSGTTITQQYAYMTPEQALLREKCRTDCKLKSALLPKARNRKEAAAKAVATKRCIQDCLAASSAAATPAASPVITQATVVPAPSPVLRAGVTGSPIPATVIPAAVVLNQRLSGQLAQPVVPATVVGPPPRLSSPRRYRL